MADISYRLTTKPFTDGRITTELFKVTDEVAERFSMWVVETRDQQIREALIQLGWTPPADESRSE